MSEHITITHERTDDIPVIIAFLLKMRVAELIDKHFPTNGNWTGLSLGQMLVVWLTFIISEGDHRLYHVEPWVAAHQHTISRSLHQEVRPRDCTDDRLATGLDYLCVAENWAECECALNQTLIRVYDLRPKTIRVDPTTVSAYVTPAGMFQLGHSKDHRPDLPQLKIALATLDPLGLPMTIATVAGNTADDPLYLPAIAKVRRSVGLAGMTYIGDCKIAALATRADIVAHQDFYLCPLSAKQVSAEELDRLLEPIWSSEQPLEEVRLTAEGQAEAQAEPDAVGFAYAVEQVGHGQSGQPQRWQERRLVVRSLARARLQEESLRKRAQRAVDEINALNERKQGKKRLAAEAEALKAAEAIIARNRVVDIVQIGVPTIVHEETKRRYGQRPAQTLRTTSVQVEARIDQAAMAQVVRRLGWRVYATNHDQELSLQQVVAAYWSEYLVEQGIRRLKGHSLSLTPLYLKCEQRIVGLIFLLSIALRVLVLMQFVARENLKREGTTLKGIYPGQPGRQTMQPTTEMMLPVFRGITLSRITVNGETYEHLTPLTPVQERIVELIGIPLETFSRLAPQLSKTAFHSHEP
ncbi:MAG TPA: IS1634 family transposase [Pyrinomonadaceae bacterium]|nr:IS1634 family transposase [Pyrinomonadaceae bacterium]